MSKCDAFNLASLRSVAGAITSGEANSANIDKTLQIIVHKFKNVTSAFHIQLHNKHDDKHNLHGNLKSRPRLIDFLCLSRSVMKGDISYKLW